MRTFTISSVTVMMLALLWAIPVTAQSQGSVFAELTGTCGGNDCGTEGIVIDKRGNVYFTMFTTGRIMKASPQGKVSLVAQLPGFEKPNVNGALGITLGKQGDLYAIVAPYPSFAPNSAVGVYRVGRNGKDLRKVIDYPHDVLSFPNYLAFDKQGNLYVSDSSNGVILRMTKDGAVKEWVRSPLIHYRPKAVEAKLPLGANGIAFDRSGSLYVAVTMGGSEPTDGFPFRGALVKIEMKPDGSAGEIKVVADRIACPDGLAFDKKGNLYVAQPLANSIMIISKGGKTSTLASGPPLAMPASLAVRDKTIYSTNLSITGFASELKLTLGPPGVSKVKLP